MTAQPRVGAVEGEGLGGFGSWCLMSHMSRAGVHNGASTSSEGAVLELFRRGLLKQISQLPNVVLPAKPSPDGELSLYGGLVCSAVIYFVVS